MKKIAFSPKRLNSPLFLLVFVQIFLSIAIWFDIFIVRQILGFVYLTFVPGYLILTLTRLDMKLDGVGKTVFSAGLSLSFLMLFGLLENAIAPAFGVPNPLSLLPIATSLSGALLIVAIVSHLWHRNNSVSIAPLKRFPKSAVIFFIPLILSVVGTYCVNVYDTNVFLIAMIAIMGPLFVAAIFSERICPSQLYPLIVFSFALALLWHVSLISSHINGYDIQLEYYWFKTTLNNARWSPTTAYFWDETYGRFNSMLSVTILPTMYSVFLNLDPERILKIVYPALFALVPLTLYNLTASFIGRKKALIASFIFIAQLTFYVELTSLTREMVGELFLALLFTVILTKKIDSMSKNFLFFIFSAGLVVSHYSTSYIFLFFMLATWVIFFIRKKVSLDITLPRVAIFFAMAFAWYMYTSMSAAYSSLLTFANRIFGDLGAFFDLSSRGGGVLMGLGLAEAPSVWNYVSRGIAYALQLFILAGLLALILKKASTRFSREYVTFSLVSGLLLGFCIVIPRFAATLNIERFYHILLFFLAPICLIGAEVIVSYILPIVKGRFVSKDKTDFHAVILLCVILIPYLFFQTSLVYEVVGSKSWSLPLSKYRMEPGILYLDLMYIEDSDVYGAQWILQHANINTQPVYADKPASYGVLNSYGMLYRGYLRIFSNGSDFVYPDSLIYLSRMNTEKGVVYTRENNWTQTSDLSYLFDNADLVYSNGNCEILKSTGG
jgi:uncharacterized membrane protein